LDQFVDGNRAVTVSVERRALADRGTAERDVDADDQFVDRHLAVAVAVTRADRHGSTHARRGAVALSDVHAPAVPEVVATEAVDRADAVLAGAVAATALLARFTTVAWSTGVATRGAFGGGDIGAATIPLVRTAQGVNPADAVLADLSFATPAIVRGATIPGVLTHAVDGAIEFRLVSAALIPRIGATRRVEVAHTGFAAHVVAAHARMLCAAVSGRGAGTR